MCRSCSEGGRRCLEPAGKRRARQRAAYQAKKASRASVADAAASADTGAAADGEAQVSPGTVTGVPLPAPGEAVTQEIVSARLAATQAVLHDIGDAPLVTQDADGWRTPTEAGLRAEAAVREAGEAIEARAHQIAAEKATDPRQDPDVLATLDGETVTSRDEFAAVVERRGDEALSRFNALDAAYKNSGGDVAARMSTLNARNDYVSVVNDAREAAARARMGDSAWDRVQQRELAGAYEQVLAEQRPMGLGGRSLPVRSDSQKATTKRLEKQLRYYPSSWLDREGSAVKSLDLPMSDGSTKTTTFALDLKVKSTGKRAVYMPVVPDSAGWRRGGPPMYSELQISKNDRGALGAGSADALHEYGHRMEHLVPQVNDIAQVHLARRTTGDGERRDGLVDLYPKARGRSGKAPESMQEFAQQERRGTREWGRPDNFVSPYMGKQNGSGDTSSEVFTTGMEGTFAGAYGGLRGRGQYREDASHRHLTLGLLGTVR